MLGTILQKELLRVFTDRRLVFSTFILPALSIFIIYSLMGSLAGNLQDDLLDHNKVIYIMDSPEQFKEIVHENKGDYNLDCVFLEGAATVEGNKEQLISGKVDIIVEFEKEFETMLANYKENAALPEINVYYNPTSDYSKVAKKDFQEIIDLYNDEVLMSRFENRDYINTFKLNDDDETLEVYDPSNGGDSLVAMVVPVLLSVILFAGAMGIGMDSITGEKERGTMATLLVTPVDREVIALGKVLSLGIVSIASTLCSFAGILASLPKMSATFSEMDTVSKFQFGPIQLVQLLVIMMTLVGIYVGIISLISVHAKSVKEAGTYISPIYMVIMIAAFSSVYSLGEGLALYEFFIPIYGSINAIKEVFAGELTGQEFLVASCSAIVTTFILIRFITKAFNDEKVMFNA